MISIIVDAGPLIALFRRRDTHHARAQRFLGKNRTRLITTLPVIGEVCYFLDARGKIALLAWIKRNGLIVQPIEVDQFDRISEIIDRYADREIDFADASLIWLADHVGCRHVMTVDRTDFSVYRSSDGTPFELVF